MKQYILDRIHALETEEKEMSKHYGAIKHSNVRGQLEAYRDMLRKAEEDEMP